MATLEHHPLRMSLLREFEQRRAAMRAVAPLLATRPDLEQALLKEQPRLVDTAALRRELQAEFTELRMAHVILCDAKTVVFSAEQAAVFLQARKSYGDGLEYRLPFPRMVLQFTAPVQVDGSDDGPDWLSCILLDQAKAPTDQEQRRLIQEELDNNPMWRSLGYAWPETGFINSAIAVFRDLNLRKLTWASEIDCEFFEKSAPDLNRFWANIRYLAIACIGYINCENVYLHRRGEVSSAVNRKRAKKGKALLEAYYVCRIRGVEYDAPNSEHSGTHHGHRYDVRGHFRRLETGKVTWVRPHQRGLTNELYIPKTYLADKRQMDDEHPAA